MKRWEEDFFKMAENTGSYVAEPMGGIMDENCVKCHVVITIDFLSRGRVMIPCKYVQSLIIVFASDF